MRDLILPTFFALADVATTAASNDGQSDRLFRSVRGGWGWSANSYREMLLSEHLRLHEDPQGPGVVEKINTDRGWMSTKPPSMWGAAVTAVPRDIAAEPYRGTAKLAADKLDDTTNARAAGTLVRRLSFVAGIVDTETGVSPVDYPVMTSVVMSEMASEFIARQGPSFSAVFDVAAAFRDYAETRNPNTRI